MKLIEETRSGKLTACVEKLHNRVATHCAFGLFHGSVLCDSQMPSFTSRLYGCFGGGTAEICFGPRRHSSTRTFSEFRLCRGTLLCNSRRPELSQQTLWLPYRRHCPRHSLKAKRAQFHQNSASSGFVVALCFATSGGRASLQALLLLQRRHGPRHLPWARRAQLHQKTLRIQILRDHALRDPGRNFTHRLCSRCSGGTGLLFRTKTILLHLRQKTLRLLSWRCASQPLEAEIHQKPSRLL